MNAWTCPDAGVWRTWLDNEASTPNSEWLKRHLHTCGSCAPLVRELEQGAAEIAETLRVLAVDESVVSESLDLRRARLELRRRAAARAFTRSTRPSPTPAVRYLALRPSLQLRGCTAILQPISC